MNLVLTVSNLAFAGREVRSASGGAGYLLTNGFHSTIRHGSIFPDLLPYVKQQQAEAVGKGFASQNISAIFASDLKRAHATGRAIHEYQPEERKPPFTVVEGLREQHFGEAEGKPWVHLQPGDSDYDPEAKVYTVPLGRSEKFPDGESLDDLRQRTVKSVLEPHLLPLIWKSRGLPEAEGGAIVCASHGLCISELGAAIVARDPDIPKGTYHFAGLVNTAWHCVRVGIKVICLRPSVLATILTACGRARSLAQFRRLTSRSTLMHVSQLMSSR